MNGNPERRGNTLGIELQVIDWRALSAAEQKRLLQRPAPRAADLSAAVAAILRRVREEGDAALAELTLQFDGLSPAAFELGPDELRTAAGRVDGALRQALRDAGRRIESLHRADLPRDSRVETAPGLSCEVRYLPLSPVGLYVPGGSAPLVSTVLMLALPAVLAGCAEIVMCSPPNRNGRIPDEVLAAADLCGVTRVFCVGGAQAVARKSSAPATPS